MYELQFLPGAERYFKKVKEKGLKAAFRKALETIQNDPYAAEAKVGNLAGVYGFDVFYNRTNYEIAYRIYEENGQLVVVILAGTRENFYQELKRYMK